MKLLRTEYTVENSRPVVYLFTRDNGLRHVIKDDSLRPYFYVDAKGSPDAVAIDGTKVSRVYTKFPGDVPQEREKYPRTWEADVPFATRYLIDKVDTIDVTEPRIMYLDIEVDNAGHMPKIAEATEQIVCISTYDSQTQTYSTFVQRSDLSPGKQSKVFSDHLHEVWYFKNELDMLRAFIGHVRSEGPDVITGWNLIRFDLMYLINRLQRVGIESNSLSPMVSAYARERDVVIKGIALIDLYDAYRNMTVNIEESYKLDFIGRKVLGEGKTDTSGNMRWLWKTRLEDLIAYNAQDVRLTVGINEKLRLLEFMDELRRLSFCQLEDTLVSSRLADSYILRMFHGKMVFPTKAHHVRSEFEGAYVGSWATGVYPNVVVFDLKSLYPSIIASANLSPETMLDSPNGFENLVHIDKFWVKQEPRGFLPQVVETLFMTRARYKALAKKETIGSDTWKLYDARQYAIKILTNALYGQTAYPGSRIYDPRIAEAITYVGRHIIKWSKDLLEKDLGFTALYADSVAGETFITIFTKRGIMKSVPISKLFKSSKSTFRHDGKEISKPNDLLTFAIDEVGAVKLCRIAKIIRHRVPARNLVLLKFRSGKQLIATKNHSMIVWDKQLHRTKICDTISLDTDSILLGLNYDLSSLWKRTKSHEWTPLQTSPFDVPRDERIDEPDIRFALSLPRRNKKKNVSKSEDDSRATCQTISIKPGSKKVFRSKKTYVPIAYRKITLEQGHDSRNYGSENWPREIQTMAGETSKCNKSISSISPRIQIFRTSRPSKGNLLSKTYQARENTNKFVIRSKDSKSVLLRQDTYRYSDISVGRKLHSCLCGRMFFPLLPHPQPESSNRDAEGEYYSRQKSRRIFDFRGNSISKDLGTPNNKNSIGGSTKDSGLHKLGVCEEKLLSVGDYQTGQKSVYVYDLEVEDCHTFLANGVFVHNTDSLFWSVGDQLDIGTVEVVLQALNDSYTDFAKRFGIRSHIFSMEFEKVYSKAFFGKSKKRYAGWLCYKSGQAVDMFEVAGFEIRRSDASQLSKKLQQDIFEMILKDGSSQEEILRHVGEAIHKVRSGDFLFSEIGIPKGITRDLDDYDKPSANIRGAKYARDVLGIDISDKPKMLYVVKVPGHPDTDVLCFDEEHQVPPGTQIDIEKMLEKVVKDKIKSIFEALGWSLKDLVYHWRGRPNNAGEQLTLL